MILNSLCCFFLLSLCLSPILSSPLPNAASIVRINLTISYGVVNADGFQRRSQVINGMFPGPEIRIRSNSWLNLTIINNLDSESTTLHLHGFHMETTPEYDGVPYVSQLPIGPLQEYRMFFKVTAAPGTYWYHSHYSLQTTAYGALIVEEEEQHEAKANNAYHYDEERTLILSDWYHQEDDITRQNLMKPSPEWKWPGNPQSLLVNGKGKFDCFGHYGNVSDPLQQERLAKCSCALEQSVTSSCSFERLYVDPGKTYRLRLVAASTLTYFSFRIPNHKLTIIEADGYYTEPFDVEELEINSGQRYSVLLKANQYPNVYKISVEPRWRAGPTTYALLMYTSFNTLVDVEPSIGYPPELKTIKRSKPGWVLSDLRTRETSYYNPKIPVAASITANDKADYTIIIAGKQERLHASSLNLKDNSSNDTFMTWTVNSIASMHRPSQLQDSATLLEQFKRQNNSLSTPRDEKQFLSFLFKKNKIVDIILQNTAALNGICEQHPWHLHGYHFHELVAGARGNYSDYSPKQISKLIRSQRPLLFRDTTTVYPNYHNTELKPHDACGFTVIRFQTTNPGIWPLHCHIPYHMEMGMQLDVIVMDKDY